jgi:excinuclease UvrABC nuclease subunit
VLAAVRANPTLLSCALLHWKRSPKFSGLCCRRLRDEALRFAVGTHRARRKKEFVRSPLDRIPGIGLPRKRALLFAFGSAKEGAFDV